MRESMQDPLVIREATRSDLESIVLVEKASFSQPYSPQLFDHFLESSSVEFLVAVSTNVVGYAFYALEGHMAHLISIAVHPDFRRRRIGSTLLTILMNRAAEAKCDSMYLEVKQNNEPAVRFYEKYGFKGVSVLSRYYKDGQDAIVFWKNLNDQYGTTV